MVKEKRGPNRTLPVVPSELVEQSIKWMRVPQSLQKRYRATFKTRSRKTAIDTYCVTECQGSDPGFREAIRDCPRQICPLWRFRPFQTTKEKT